VRAPRKTEDAKPKNAKRTENYEPKTVRAEKEQPTDSRMKPKDASDPGDRSSAAVASLNETQRAILDAIPSEEPIAVDKLKHLGMPMGTLLAAISVLQIKGLVRSLPGGMISRK
jgi:predicted Rossmann fold nucleotide-binding protein DprA/Smf involved in DNA uptake